VDVAPCTWRCTRGAMTRTWRCNVHVAVQRSCTDAKEMMCLLRDGSANIVRAETRMNKASSRSHTVLQVSTRGTDGYSRVLWCSRVLEALRVLRVGQRRALSCRLCAWR
jgi:hypothetical protein